MAKKSKRPLHPGRGSSPVITSESVAADLADGRFREAIAGYKDLMKRRGAGPSRQDADATEDDLKDGLARAYAGRARQLAEKGMLKEALVMWENRAALGQIPPCLDHAVCLLRLGRADRAAPLLDAMQASIDPDERSRLLGHLAAQTLAGIPGLSVLVPEDHPIRVQQARAEEALDAYCAGNDRALAQALGSIPFRSPYRDLVQILKALMRLDPAGRDARGDWPEEARKEAGALLDRIPDRSGFAPLRDAARLALLGEAALAPRLREAGPATREWVFALRGWSAERVALWSELEALGPAPKPKDLLRAMVRHRRVLGEAWVHERGLRLLLPKVQPAARWWTEVWGRPPSKLDGYQLDAWESESGADPWNVATCWQDYAALLLDAGKHRGEQDSDTALRIALVQRRAESLFQVVARMEPDRDPESLQATIARDLETSLDYDPDDRATYLALIAYYLRGKALKEARGLLKRAQDRWPSDKAILTAAMDIALASGAYKKAAAIAAEILAVDPINSGIRERLVDAHLAHARKNLVDRRPDLAARALTHAESWARGERLAERLEPVRGLTEFLAGDVRGEARLRSLAEGLGNGLAARLVLLLEASACAIPGVRFLNQLGLGKSPTPDKADLQIFLARLRAYLDAGTKLTPEIERELTEPLKRAARLELDRGELEPVCETLRRTGLHAARLAFADAALKRWRGEPVFELHAFEARHQGALPWDIPMREMLRLEQALERAREQGDTRLVHRLIETLNGPPGRFARPPRGRRGPLFGASVFDEDDDEDPFEDEDLPGPAGSHIGLLADMIRTLGPDGLRELMRTPGPLGDSLRELERGIGKETLNVLINALGAQIHRDDPPFPDPAFFNDGPSPSARRRARAKRKRR